MKLKNVIQLLCFAFVVMCIATSCVKEGPIGYTGTAGENGKDGANGKDANATCLTCHAQANMAAKEALHSAY